MTTRIKKLRKESLDAIPYISDERAKLLTDFYKQAKEEAVPIMRAKALSYILLSCKLRLLHSLYPLLSSLFPI